MLPPSLSPPTAPARKRPRLALGLVAALLPTTAHAGGFALDTQSARAVSMGTAMTAHVDDPSAIFYNAAGLVAGDEGLAVQVGALALLPNVTFKPEGGGPVTASNTGALFPPHAYLRWKIAPDVALGVGLSTPFGNTTKWPAGWEGDSLARRGSIDALDIGASMAVRILPFMRLGLGVDALRAQVEQDRSLGAAGGGALLSLESTAWGLGANAGLQVDVVPELLSLGVAYRASVPLDLTGRATFSNVPAPLSPLLADQSVTSTFTLPQQWQLGLAVKPLPSLRVALDAWWVDWSTADALAVKFQNPMLDAAQPLNWGSRWNGHLGAEYTGGDALKLRLGLKYDPSPVPASTLAPSIPDADRMALALGAGYAWGRFTVDVAWQLTLLTVRRSELPVLPGEYSGFANVFGLTLGVRP
jgi:long-chain fatty acid transport protein